MERQKPRKMWEALGWVGLLVLACSGHAVVKPAKVAPPLGPDLPVGGVTVLGKHLVFHVPPSEKANAMYLIKVGDAALETYARDLGASVPADPISVTILDTDQDYEAVAKFYSNGALRFNQGFSHNDLIFLHFAPRPGETVLTSGSMITHLFAHELCHALHARLFPSYDNQPVWLKEGVAEAWAEHALSENGQLMADRSPWEGTRLIALRQEAQEGHPLSIMQILDLSYSKYRSSENRQQFRTYSRSFALVRMLDDPAPANAARRARFRAFLKDVDTQRQDDLTAYADAAFLKEFGGPALPALDAELRERVATEKTYPWEQYGTEVYPLADGALFAEAAQDNSALAFADAQPLTGPTHLHAHIDVVDIGTRQANIVFGRTQLDDYYMLAFGPGYVTFSHHRKNYQILKNQDVDANLFGPGEHTLDVFVQKRQAEALLDGRKVGTFKIRSGSFLPGQWGIGASEGRVIFHEFTAQRE